MQATPVAEKLDQYGGDELRKRETSRLWYRLTDTSTDSDTGLLDEYQSRSTSLLAPELIASTEWNRTQGPAASKA